MPGGCASWQEAGKPEQQRGKCNPRAESPRGPAGRPWGWLRTSLWFWFLSILFVYKYSQALPADSVDTENTARGQVRLVPVVQHLSCGWGWGGTARREGINNAMTAVSSLSKTLGGTGQSRLSLSADFISLSTDLGQASTQLWDNLSHLYTSLSLTESSGKPGHPTSPSSPQKACF